MADLIDLMSGVSTVVRAGWIVWLMWAIVQIYWYRTAREMEPELDLANQDADCSSLHPHESASFIAPVWSPAWLRPVWTEHSVA